MCVNICLQNSSPHFSSPYIELMTNFLMSHWVQIKIIEQAWARTILSHVAQYASEPSDTLRTQSSAGCDWNVQLSGRRAAPVVIEMCNYQDAEQRGWERNVQLSGRRAAPVVSEMCNYQDAEQPRLWVKCATLRTQSSAGCEWKCALFLLTRENFNTKVISTLNRNAVSSPKDLQWKICMDSRATRSLFRANLYHFYSAIFLVYCL